MIAIARGFALAVLAIVPAAVQDAPASQDFDPEARLKALGIELGAPRKPIANYVNAVRTGNLVFLAGHVPAKPDGGFVTGKVGKDLDLEAARAAARLTTISLLTSLKGEIGDLRKVRRVVKVFGMVNAVADFTEHPQVMNAASDLLVEVFGPRGKHARAAVGMASLPRNVAVEIEMVVEIEP
jgi:enamine deaminase RidA (YjgF/YER057c/UK114 family)